HPWNEPFVLACISDRVGRRATSNRARSDMRGCKPTLRRPVICLGVGTAGPFSFPRGDGAPGDAWGFARPPVGLILGLRSPPLAVAARQKDGIASSVRRRALGNPVRVRTGRKGEEAPPGAPPAEGIAPLRPRCGWPDLRPRFPTRLLSGR